MTLSLRVRTSGGNEAAFLHLDECSLELIERDTIPSSLQVTGPRDVMEQCFLTAAGAEDYRRGIFVDEDGMTRMSGILTEALIEAETITCTWDSDILRLWGRHVYPNPAQAWDAQTVAYWLHALAPAETIALDLIKDQVGPSALTGRRLPLTIPASVGRGTAQTAKLRFDNIGRWLSDLGEATGLRFSVVQADGQAQPAVVVRQTVDLTDLPPPAVSAVYGSTGSGGPGRLADDSWQVRMAIPGATVMLGAGSDTLAARKLREKADPDAVATWGRIEALNEQTNIDVLTDLDKSNAEQLIEESKPVEVTGVSILETEGLILGKDVLLGDLVGVDLYRSISITDRLRQIKTEIKDGVTTVTGAVGSPDAGLTRTQKDYLKQARSRRKAAQ